MKKNDDNINFLDDTHAEELNHFVLSEELSDFENAIDEKIKLAEGHAKDCLVPILSMIKKDILKSILHFKNGQLSFHEAYEEVTSLYVFTEMYFKFEAQAEK